MIPSGSPSMIESAKLSMLAARKALENYEMLKGFTSSAEHTKLTQKFYRAANVYLKLSQNQR